MDVIEPCRARLKKYYGRENIVKSNMVLELTRTERVAWRWWNGHLSTVGTTTDVCSHYMYLYCDYIYETFEYLGRTAT